MFRLMYYMYMYIQLQVAWICSRICCCLAAAKLDSKLVNGKLVEIKLTEQLEMIREIAITN